MQNSQVIGLLYTASMMQPGELERSFLPQMRVSPERPALESCLSKVQRLGMTEMQNQRQIDEAMRAIGMGGSTGSSGLGQMSLWATDLSAALETGRWTNTTSATYATLLSLFPMMCQMMGGGGVIRELGQICEAFPGLMYEGARLSAQVCDIRR